MSQAFLQMQPPPLPHCSFQNGPCLSTQAQEKATLTTAHGSQAEFGSIPGGAGQRVGTKQEEEEE
jgi:hypothetical protein